MPEIYSAARFREDDGRIPEVTAISYSRTGAFSNWTCFLPSNDLKIGLALGAGSARGWAHIGVINALEERGIRPDIATGASVGALVAAAYASGQLEVLEAWVSQLTKIDVWRLLDTTFSGGGVMRGNRLMRAIGEQIEDRRIEELPVKFAAVAADLNTGLEVWLRDGSMLNAVRASSGMPGLFSPMWYQNRWMIDGGVVNPVPVSLCRALGADYVIAVNLNTHFGQHPGLRRPRVPNRDKQPSMPQLQPTQVEGWTSLDRWSALVDGLVEALKRPRSEEPGLFNVITASINIMQDRITRSRLVGDPPTIMITPDLGHFQVMDFHRAEEAVEIGYRAVENAAKELEDLNALAE